MFWKPSISALVALAACLATNAIASADQSMNASSFVQGQGPLQVPGGPDASGYASQHTRTYMSPQRGNEKTTFECMNAVFPGSNCVHPPYHIIQYPHPKEKGKEACEMLGKRVANITHTSLYALLNQLLEVGCSDAGALANQICGLKHDNGTNLIVFANGSWGFKEAQPSIRYMIICE